MDREHMGIIERLQALDEPTKHKVLVVATLVIMVVVIYFWLAYFNNLVAGISSPQVAQNGNDVGPAAGSGFSDAVKNASALVYGRFMDVAHALGNILQAPRQYIIQPPK